MITAETIDRVTRFNGEKLPVVSVYLGLDADRRDRGSLPTRASSLLHEIRPMTEDHSLDREARLSVRGDIERIEGELAQERLKPGAVAIFSCSGAGFYEEIELPRPVRDRVVVDGTPWVRPMLAVLDEYHRTCVLILDKESARTWELYQGEINETSEVLDQALRKPDYAGWYGLEEYRVRNKAEELAKKHFRKVATVLDDFQRAGRFELLAVGGHDYEVPVFMEFLPHNLRGSVAGTFAIDPNTATIGDIRESADAVVDRYERDEERRWVAEVFEKEAAGGNAAVGLERCLWGGSVAAIQRLLVQEGATAPGVVCDESGWLAEAGDTCIICGQPTRKTDDVVDELAEAVIDTGGTVEHVLADTPLRDHAVAAALRFPLPPRPTDQA
jgi:peptide chain release factor subunit 1